MPKVLKAKMSRMKILSFIDGQMFVYCQLFCLLLSISHLEASYTKTAQSKDVWNENLEFLRLLFFKFRDWLISFVSKVRE